MFLCVAAFSLLVVDTYARRPGLIPDFDEVLVPLATMLVVGAVTTAIIKKMRGLAGLRESRYSR